jgi:hypothetical protein
VAWAFHALFGVLQSASGKFSNIRVNLELLSVSYPQYPEIGDALKEVRRSPGAAPIPTSLQKIEGQVEHFINVRNLALIF